MIQFAEAFPEEEIVAALWRQLSWSHFRELLLLNQPFQREFYAVTAMDISCAKGSFGWNGYLGWARVWMEG